MHVYILVLSHWGIYFYCYIFIAMVQIFFFWISYMNYYIILSLDIFHSVPNLSQLSQIHDFLFFNYSCYTHTYM